jgi:hypothetical protein
MSRGACGCDSSRGRGHIEDSRRISVRMYRGGVEGASVGFVRLIVGLLEGTLGSSSARALLFFFLALSPVRHLIQVERVLLFGLEGSVRKEERGSVWAHLEQHFEAIQGSGCELEEKSKKNASETRRKRFDRGQST